MLRPTHSYFINRQGFIEEYSAYKHDSESKRLLLYPRCKYQDKNNPYRRYRLSRSNTARTVKKLLAFKETNHLDRLKSINFELTFNKELSQWLGSQPGGLEMAWRRFSRWRDNYLAKLMPDRSATALWVTLHFWSTDDPISYHFHFHACLLNYVELPAFDDPENGQAYHFVERFFPISEDGKLKPFTNAQLKVLKSGWKKVEADFCYRHRIDSPSLGEGRKVNLSFSYLDFNKADHIPRIVNRLKYMTRPPIVDYAKASNQHPNYPWPTERLVKYTTKLRTFGYAKHLKAFIGQVDDSDSCKLSPLTGGKMEYVGRFTREELLFRAGGQLGRLDFRKGKPILGTLTDQELDWLKAVDYLSYPNPGWYKAHRDDPAALLAPRAPP